MLHSTTSASVLLKIPVSTLLSWEATGAIPRFARDGGGRRVITEHDIAYIRAYAQGRRRAQGPELGSDPATTDQEDSGGRAA